MQCGDVVGNRRGAGQYQGTGARRVNSRDAVLRDEVQHVARGQAGRDLYRGRGHLGVVGVGQGDAAVNHGADCVFGIADSAAQAGQGWRVVHLRDSNFLGISVGGTACICRSYCNGARVRRCIAGVVVCNTLQNRLPVGVCLVASRQRQHACTRVVTDRYPTRRRYPGRRCVQRQHHGCRWTCKLNRDCVDVAGVSCPPCGEACAREKLDRGLFGKSGSADPTSIIQIYGDRHHALIGRDTPCRQRRPGRDRTRQPVKFPTATQRLRTNQISRRSNISTRRQRQRPHKRRTTLVGTGVATPQPHIAVAAQSTADGGQVCLVLVHGFQRQGAGAKAHFTRAAVGHDVNRLHVFAALQGARHLRHGVLGVGQQHGLHVRAQPGDEGAEVADVAVDKDDFFGV